MNQEKTTDIQKIVVFQQNGNGEAKVQGIRKYGANLFVVVIVSIDIPLPPVIDDTKAYLPSEDIRAYLVLDFLKHPDLSYDLALMCGSRGIPVVASGKKLRVKGMFTPPT